MMAESHAPALAQYLGMQKQQHAAASPDVPKAARKKLTPHERREARHFYRMFLALKDSIGNGSPSYRFTELQDASAGLTCFVRFLEGCAALQERRGTPIDPVTFMRAQIWWYGEDCYPAHLLAANALRIYDDYCTQERALVFQLSQDDQHACDEELLAYLSDVRGETPAQVLDALEDAGVFSDAFLAAKRGTTTCLSPHAPPSPGATSASLPHSS